VARFLVDASSTGHPKLKPLHIVMIYLNKEGYITCFDTSKKVSGILIAKKDIPVFKIFKKETWWPGKFSYLSLYQGTDIKDIITKRCYGDLIPRGQYGYYSYAYFTPAIHHIGNYYVCKLYIPKDTKYIRGYWTGNIVYRSEYLKSRCRSKKIVTVGCMIKFKGK